MKEVTVAVEPGEEFRPHYPTILTTPTSLPRQVPPPQNIQEALSDSGRESERPPQWVELTQEEQQEAGAAMATVVRKYSLAAAAPNNTSIPSDMALSEGVLSDMSRSSPPPSLPLLDSKTYSKDNPDVLGERESV